MTSLDCQVAVDGVETELSAGLQHSANFGDGLSGTFYML